MNAVHHPRVYMRSLATRRNRSELSAGIQEAISIVKRAGFDFIIVETSGIGQGDAAIVEVSDISLYVMTAEFGAPSQLEKIEMLDFADLVAINKFDRKGSEDALRDVRKQYKRNHQLFDVPDEQLPIYGTMANRFHDPGVNRLYRALIDKINEKMGLGLGILPAGGDRVRRDHPSHHSAGALPLFAGNRPNGPGIPPGGGGTSPGGPAAVPAEGCPRSPGVPRRRKRSSRWIGRSSGNRRSLHPENQSDSGRVARAEGSAMRRMSTSTRCGTGKSARPCSPKPWPEAGFPRWPCPALKIGAISCAGPCWKTCRADSPTPPECFP